MVSDVKKLSIFTIVISVIYGILFGFFRYIDMSNIPNSKDNLLLITYIGFFVSVVFILMAVAFYRISKELSDICQDNDELMQLQKEVKSLKQEIVDLKKALEKE